MGVPWEQIIDVIGGVGKGMTQPEQQIRQSFGADRVGGAADAFQNNFNVQQEQWRNSIGSPIGMPQTPNVFANMQPSSFKLPGSGDTMNLGIGLPSGVDDVNKQAQNRGMFLGGLEGEIPNAFGSGGGGGGGAGGTGGVGGGVGTSGGGRFSDSGIGGFGQQGLGAGGMGGFDPTVKGEGRGRPGDINMYEPGENRITDPQALVNEGLGIYAAGQNGDLGGVLDWLMKMDLPLEQMGNLVGMLGIGIPGLGSAIDKAFFNNGPGGGGGSGGGQQESGWGWGGYGDDILGTGSGNPQGATGGAYQTSPGYARQVPGAPGQPVPIMAHGGEFVGRPGGTPPQAGPPPPVPGQAPPQQPMGGGGAPPIAPPPAGGFQQPPPRTLTPQATMPGVGQPVAAAPTGQPPQGGNAEEQYISAASLLGAVGAV